ncbi:flagellar motor switch protein FliM [Oceanobacillus profundus]|jgi:flagellar motor switch protein FliM|uniref:Flagellar motor switch protein FliM n=1 Tax=Oceanobacillus profundus TaxID=372463 RepID=A0A417YKF3_9BACI|nr:flagellar motor switch protein FliM [Oceanobacillus profundus]MBR3121571.1 flagellar motor switch protein FliM [Oceanobacillus sp.]MCM3396361.1 flagellar motor switch protein FliM [Oceanobacillus profundus]MDO6449629.1 flagellar motor switch protein FliM [Oceanobacillus profundus]RHW33633.1 flagellar motor switch protein FliM [Oceanobacillus profundus]
MDEVLSQNEIDALLSAITSGEMDAEELKKEEQEKKVRVYDFKRALRFSKDQIRSISRIHENYARMLTTYFSSQLRTYVNISVTSVDQVPFEEFVRSIQKVTILNIYSVEPLDGNLIMEVNPNIGYALLDRILGGKGNTINKNNNLTEIEKLLLRQFFEKAVYTLEESWASVTEIKPRLEEFEENPQFLQMVAPNDTVVVVSMTAAIGETTGMINICIPHIILEPIIPKLSVHYWMQAEKKNRDATAFNKMSKNLKQTEVEVKSILGEGAIAINEFLALKQNDVITLDQKIDLPLRLTINNEVKFLVQPGKYKNKMSVQILDEIKRGEQYDE